MSISIDKISTSNINTQNKTPKAQNTPETKSARQFDQVLISGQRDMTEENKVTKKMAQKIILEVRTGVTPQEKLDTLKDDILRGRYQVDADEIASKMLRYKGEA